MTTDERIAELKRKLETAQLVGWHVTGRDQQKARQLVEQIRKAIDELEANRGKGGAT